MARPLTDCRRTAARALLLAALLWSAQAAAADETTTPALPSFEELEAAGATIGQITVRTDDIFDLGDPKEDNALFRLANKLHIKTRPSVIARQLLFKSGDPVDARKIEETERLLRGNHYLYEVDIHPLAVHDGVVDIEVVTRDTWTLEPGFSFSRQGGANSTGLTFREENLLGTGVTLGVERKSDVDRTGTIFEIAQPHAMGGRTALNYKHTTYDDGNADSFGVVRPFYELDARWSAGVTAGRSDVIDSVYEAGQVTARYRHKQEQADIFGGWSNGLIDGWTQRHVVGLNYNDNTYMLEPGEPPPAQLPDDRKLVAPYYRYDILEDGYTKLKNRDLIERPEYFDFGFASHVQIGHAFTDLGSTENLWTYSASVSDGFQLERSDLLAGVGLSGEYGDGYGRNQFFSGSLRYFRPTSKRAVFYTSIAGDYAHNPDTNNLLLLGGDNGLRGYPLRYQTGNRRVLFTAEQRIYSDWYPFRLFRVGAAVFFDAGRAWGGEDVNAIDAANRGWLSDVGMGLRILSARSAFGNVIHIDVAFPLHHDPNIQSTQFLVKTYKTF